MLLVVFANPVERNHGQEHVEHVTKLAAHLPGRDLRWVRFLVQVVDATMQPMSISIDVELLEVSELVQGVVLQVVRLDLVVVSWLWLVFEPVLCHEARRFVGDLVLWVIAWVVFQTSSL